MYIGAHVSTAGGLDKAIERGEALGVEGLQIFPSAPVQWKIRGFSDADCDKFKQDWPKQFEDVVFHGIYLINLAGEGENLERSKTALIDTMTLSTKLGIKYTIFHTGTYKDEAFDKKAVGKIVNEILDKTPKESILVFENTAGSTIGGKLEDLADLIEVSNDKSRVGVCIDSCHSYAAGYDLVSSSGYELFKEKIKGLVGVDKVKCWHLNDSKFALGNKRDRHENIDQGFLGLETFENIVNDPDWKNICGYLEVPGFDNHGVDKKNVDTLKSIRTN